MAIEVKHGVSPAAVVAAGFGGGQGRSRAAAARGGAAATSREQAQIRALGARAQQAQRDREFRAGESALSHERGLERLSVNAQLQDQLASGASERRIGELEYRLTTQQRLKLSQLAEAEANALASSDFSPDEKQELRRRFAAKRAGIQPVERPRELTPAERFEQSTHTAKDGTVYPLNPDGSFGRPLYQPPERQPTFRDRISAFQAATAFATNPETGLVDPAGLQQAMAAMGFGEGGQEVPPAQGRAMPGTVEGLKARNAREGALLGQQFTGPQLTGPQTVEELLAGVDISDRRGQPATGRRRLSAPGFFPEFSPATIPGSDFVPPVGRRQPLPVRKLEEGHAAAGQEIVRLTTEVAGLEQEFWRMRRQAAESRFAGPQLGLAQEALTRRSRESNRAEERMKQIQETRAKILEKRAAAERRQRGLRRKLLMFDAGRSER